MFSSTNQCFQGSMLVFQGVGTLNNLSSNRNISTKARCLRSLPSPTRERAVWFGSILLIGFSTIYKQEQVKRKEVVNLYLPRKLRVCNAHSFCDAPSVPNFAFTRIGQSSGPITGRSQHFRAWNLRLTWPREGKKIHMTPNNKPCNPTNT